MQSNEDRLTRIEAALEQVVQLQRQQQSNIGAIIESTRVLSEVARNHEARIARQDALLERLDSILERLIYREGREE